VRSSSGTFANIGADIWYDLELPEHTFHVVAEDASPVWRVWTADHLVLPPAKRYEVVLIVGAEAGTYPLRTRAFDQGSAGDQYPEAIIATLSNEGDEVEPVALPERLVPESDIRSRTVVGEREFVFTEDDPANQFHINGESFDPARTDAKSHRRHGRALGAGQRDR
jgi:FtsP/CotA-like multicopper oxidase with cupredoxin domain